MNEIKIDLLGSDPEFFLVDSKGTLKSAIGVIPGTKEEPHFLPQFGDLTTLQIDNVLGEISVQPAKTGEELWDNIQKVLKYVQDTYLTPKGLAILHASSGEFDAKELEDPIAQILGCSPTLNAWQFGYNEAPDASSNFRGCGSHIHISYEDPSMERSFQIAQTFDLFGTLNSVIRDPDTKRREFYGQAGEMRILDYGLEVRTPGGFILSSKEEFLTMIEAVHKTVDFINNKNEISLEDQALIQLAINTSDKHLAEKLLKKYS